METIKIYTLAHPETGEIRYVGYTKTTLEVRLDLHMRKARGRRSNHRINWINSLNAEPVIKEIDSGLYEDRNWIEIMYIALFKSWGFRLTNGTDGGDGGDTWIKLSPEAKELARARLSKSNKGKIKGIPKSPEHLEKMQAHLSDYNGKIKSGEIKHPSKDFKHTKESRDKMSKAKKGISNHRKNSSNYGKIQQLDLKTGEFIAEFENPCYAVEAVGQLNNTNIIRAARGKQKSSYGYKWKFM